MPVAGRWILKDCGSANGTFVNGVRVDAQRILHSGDRIRLGDSEIVFRSESSDSSIALREAPVSATISIPYRDIVDTQPGATVDLERLRILNALAVELIEDRPLDRLFGFIVDRLLEHLEPSRVAIAILNPDSSGFETIELRKNDPDDDAELTISRTLLREVVDEKKVLAFVDTSADEKLASAKSIVMQGIRSAIIAPLTLGDAVAGVLYLDYQQARRTLSDDDLHLVGQIARLASMKLETTRLREEALEKRLLDEELRTAATIQRRLLPADPPDVPGFTLAGSNRACRTVSGDYYDFWVQPDGRVWFTIADVAGKGVTAALIMASLQAAFRIFVKEAPAPDILVARLNETLRETIPSTRFVTLVAGRLDPATGEVELTNAGHPHPILLNQSGTLPFGRTDLLLGLFPNARYQAQRLRLEPGDALVLFTDGAMECVGEDGEELGVKGIRSTVETSWGRPAPEVSNTLREAVLRQAGSAEDLGDDLTLMVLSRDR